MDQAGGAARSTGDVGKWRVLRQRIHARESMLPGEAPAGALSAALPLCLTACHGHNSFTTRP